MGVARDEQYYLEGFCSLLLLQAVHVLQNAAIQHSARNIDGATFLRGLAVSPAEEQWGDFLEYESPDGFQS